MKRRNLIKAALLLPDGIAEAQIDFLTFLDETGKTESELRELVETADTPFELDLEVWGVELAPSRIEGTGVEASRWIPSGSAIPVRVDGIRTQVGRYTNHSPAPNCVIDRVKNDGPLVLVTSRNIDRFEELTVDYRQARKVALL
jgi:hypothetical protein